MVFITSARISVSFRFWFDFFLGFEIKSATPFTFEYSKASDFRPGSEYHSVRTTIAHTQYILRRRHWRCAFGRRNDTGREEAEAGLTMLVEWLSS